ncbi:GNAT family N-acetyltransferase [Mucilaginibacter robiniae]|uniref:GNAT family N-acetyltransferase n=1 Tax=Mucilaginibacter robiniae TaxID=2728022 RepID=A0A7L5E6P3_9SPHI|nr:GNAT family N-acetyltransferase [Mucilaginibacter robiniae]QJD98047.1 GNAT family N-acetyltransferase [Mucilaginibacter robiniae]
MQTFVNYNTFLNKGFTISTDNSLLNFDVVYSFLTKESYWAKGLTAERLHKAIAGSVCFGIYKNQEQVGFARVITDKATFAYICDVFVLQAYRGIGLSKWLIQTILNYPEFDGLRRWTLATADAHGLYQQMGFNPLNNTDRWMEIFTPYPVITDL